MKYIMRIVKSIGKSSLIIEGITEKIKNEVKEQIGGFIPMLLETFAASILENTLTGKGLIRAGEGVIRADQNN